MDFYEEISKAIQSGKSLALCTVIETKGSVPRHAGSKMLVYSDGSHVGSVGGGEVESKTFIAAQNSIQNSKSVLINFELNQDDDQSVGLCGGSVRIFIDVISQKPKIIVYGAGHVGKAVAQLAKWLNFQVVVSDDREEFCNQSNIPEADLFLTMPIESTPNNFEIDQNTYLVLVTRGADVDIKGIPALLRTKAAYIGVIGSQKRWEFTKKSVLEAGISEIELLRIKSPIGMDIHAETPEEIAVSIMAEIILCRNNPENLRKF